MSDPATTAGIVLAAGAGRRFGGPKAPFEFDGERLVDRAVRLLGAAGCDPIVVVLGAWRGSVPGAVVIDNHDWAEGMGSSLRLGLHYVDTMTDAENALITLVDLPGLTSEAAKRVIDAPPGPAVATFHGERGHPVRIPRIHFPALLTTLHGDQGARSFLSGRDDVAYVEIADIASGEDLDFAPAH